MNLPRNCCSQLALSFDFPSKWPDLHKDYPNDRSLSPHLFDHLYPHRALIHLWTRRTDSTAPNDLPSDVVQPFSLFFFSVYPTNESFSYQSFPSIFLPFLFLYLFRQHACFDFWDFTVSLWPFKCSSCQGLCHNCTHDFKVAPLSSL